MVRRLSFGILIIGLLAAAVPDLVNYLSVLMERSAQLHTRVIQFKEIARQYPVILAIFGLSFGLAAMVTDNGRRNIVWSNFIQFALMLPVGTWLLRFFLQIVAGALVKYNIPNQAIFFSIEIASTLLMIILAHSMLTIEIGVAGYIAAVLITVAMIVLPAEPYNLTFLPAINYTLLGGIISYYMAQYDEKIRRPGE